ncbi:MULTISPECIES: aspartate-semialdehyde dehydrogenase [Prochlorococcus]|uniref:aspartate-semialdehyde dehydrogenase n=1 Tax=Prochlorococcus sp. MIT 0601 TaxID=1499498 RepID=UPI00187C5559|nr:MULTISPECIES: aspartate-semialdehyde dehydrogenase [Prochlorococcus]
MKNCLPDRPLNVAVLGATGAVGQELLDLLEARSFPINNLRLLASSRSAGEKRFWKAQVLSIEEVAVSSFNGLDLVFASAGGSISRQWREAIKDSGAILIDNSSAFRMDNDVPLIVPEVNPEDAFNHQGLIANPNCTTILLTVVLKPLSDLIPIKRVVLSTYQSASGAGAKAMSELKNLTQKVLNDKEVKSEVLPYSLAFNLFLHNSPLAANSYCEEEMKMVNETRKIMGVPQLPLTATCVRVPVLRAHSEAVNIEFEKPLDVAIAKKALAEAKGIELIEDYQANRFPMPIDVTGKDSIAVGRIRQDISNENCLELWLCGDQIRKGAALNAIQIAELLLPS